MARVDRGQEDPTGHGRGAPTDSARGATADTGRGAPADLRHRQVRAAPAGLALTLALVLAACGTGPSTSPSPAATPETSFPSASFTGGSATASVSLPRQEPIRFAGGWCERPPGDAWLTINIGDPNGAEYFGLLVGPHPYGGAGASPVAGGGTFSEDSTVVSWRHGGKGAALARRSVTVKVGSGAHDGTFSGRLPDGTEVTGEFGC